MGDRARYPVDIVDLTVEHRPRLMLLAILSQNMEFFIFQITDRTDYIPRPDIETEYIIPLVAFQSHLSVSFANSFCVLPAACFYFPDCPLCSRSTKPRTCSFAVQSFPSLSMIL